MFETQKYTEISKFFLLKFRNGRKEIECADWGMKVKIYMYRPTLVTNKLWYLLSTNNVLFIGSLWILLGLSMWC